VREVWEVNRGEKKGEEKKTQRINLVPFKNKEAKDTRCEREKGRTKKKR